ncbi:MAG TPA: DcaP family trimeric outer membrane transporter [bacterium]|nr:DcaP family trimeric outer membrane transporter [bacterium]HPS29144.1 DcaP family trimeric outer membrane transporter [bacterium]
MKKMFLLSIILFMTIGLFSEEKPAAEAPKPVAEEPTAVAAEQPATAPVEEKKDSTDLNELAKQLEQLKKDSEKRDQELLKNRSEMDILKEELKRIKEEKTKEKAVEKIEKKLSEDKKPEKTITFKPYGFFELYGYGNDAVFSYNDLMVYVSNEKKSTANISARNTRLGLDIAVPYITSFDLSGRFEVDFFGSLPDSANSEASTGIRMRHAFFNISKTFKSKTTIALLAGQTWATAIIPIFPSVINPAAGWGAGNPWNRLPLAELSLVQSAGKIDMGLKFAAVKPISGASANRKSFIEINIDAGDASHWPSLQSQIFLKSNFSMVNFYWAAGGAYGRENYTGGIKINGENTPTFGDEVEVWLFDTALQLTHKYAEIQGKFFIGENLDMFGVFGGSLIKDKQGYVKDSMRAMGYWAELSLKPFKGMRLSTGLGAELSDINNKASYSDIIYDKNSTFWISAFYTLYDHFTTGFEWQNTVTTKDREKLGGNSFMGSLRFSF